MSRLLTSGLVLAALVAGCQPAVPSMEGFQVSQVGDAGEIIVQFKEAGGSAAVEREVPALSHQRALLLDHTHLYRVRGDLATALDRLSRNPRVAYAEPNVMLYALATTNDPYLGQLWGHGKIQAQQAWETTKGSPSVIVADVDTGVDYTHPDLAGGQVILGPDLVNKDNDPRDDHGHGTHVAGTIAATGNNALGVVGVSYQTRILAIKVLSASGSGTLADVADGIVRAQQLGARVINLSLGGMFSTTTLLQAVNQVAAAGSLVVAAAGNNGNKRAMYPAAYSNAFAVGASDQNDMRASFSNWGDYVDIAAPGVGILSTTQGGYASWSGTSMSTPHVAAVAALLLAKRPNATVSQLRTALQAGDDPVSGFRNGIGRLNASKTLAALP